MSFLNILSINTDLLNRVLPSDTEYLSAFDETVSNLKLEVPSVLQTLRDRIGKPTLPKAVVSAIMAETPQHYAGCDSKNCSCKELFKRAPITKCTKPTCHTSGWFPHVSPSLVKLIAKDAKFLSRLDNKIAPKLSYSQVTQKVKPTIVENVEPKSDEVKSSSTVEPMVVEETSSKPSYIPGKGLKRKTYTVTKPAKFAASAHSPMPREPADIEATVFRWVVYFFKVSQSDPTAAPLIQELIRAAPSNTRELWNLLCAEPKVCDLMRLDTFDPPE